MSQQHADGDRDTRAAVDKAISLLASFRDEAYTGLGVSELARRSDMSKSTAFRLLAMLIRNGVVEKTGTVYRLGAQLQTLAAPVDTPRHAMVRDALTPFLVDLYELTHETVHLAVLQGTDVVYLNKLYGHRTVAAPSRIGGRAPAHCTGVGKVLLAYDPVAREHLLQRDLRPLTSASITDATQLGLELDRVRGAGVAKDRGEVASGLTCVAAPVMVRGAVVAALSVSGATGRFAPQTVEPLLRRVCAAAGQTLTARRGLVSRPTSVVPLSA